MQHNPAVAIDFGTSRTKVAWRDDDGEIHLLDWGGKPYLPSLFYLPSATDETLMGDDAEEAYEFEPHHIIEQLKLTLSESSETLAVSTARQTTPQALLDQLFCHIADRISELPPFKDGLGEVVTTIPAQSSMALEGAINRASREAGFIKNVSLYEPDAAARGWLLENEDTPAVVVLDCGGGTTDWALMLNSPRGLVRPREQALRPGNIALGGTHVDEALMRYILSSDGAQLPEGNPPEWLRGKVRQYKEAVFSNKPPRAIRLRGGQPAPLTPEKVADLYQQTLVAPVMAAFSDYLERVKQTYPDIPLLLVGGSVAAPLLASLQQQHSQVQHLADAAVAVIQGALAQPQKRVSTKKTLAKAEPKWQLPQGVGVSEDHYGTYADLSLAGEVQRMRWIEAGTFMMGSPESELERDDDETQHEVTLSEGYWLADTAVTQALWQAVMGENPSEFSGPDRPVENVSWEEVQQFIQRLNQTDDELCLRLPTEAEWEYACRAGTQTPFSFGENITTAQANFDGDCPYAGGEEGRFREETVAVKALPANGWGLYQMHGNVWELCSDWYGPYPRRAVTDPAGLDTGEHRVCRGGSWASDGRALRSAYRSYWRIGYGSYGFRLARGPKSKPSE